MKQSAARMTNHFPSCFPNFGGPNWHRHMTDKPVPMLKKTCPKSLQVFDFWRPPLHQLLKGLLRGWRLDVSGVEAVWTRETRKRKRQTAGWWWGKGHFHHSFFWLRENESERFFNCQIRHSFKQISNTSVVAQTLQQWAHNLYMFNKGKPLL